MENKMYIDNIKNRIEEWTWFDLAWLLVDCDDEDYPEDSRSYETYQIPKAMQNALDTVKKVIYDTIKTHYAVLVMMSNVEDRSYWIWEKVYDQVYEVGGKYGATDTASREALLFKLDVVFD